LDQQERGESKIPIESKDSNYSLPFLKAAQNFVWLEIVRNESFYHDIREWWQFDEAACCSDHLPLENEIVFHHRNFLAELKRSAWKLGFFEILPTNAANRRARDTHTPARFFALL
jgi:hypothetical protein